MIAFLALLSALQEPARPGDERERWLAPLRTVTLEKEQRTAGDCLEEFRRQTGIRIDAEGVDVSVPVERGWRETPVFQALDELCDVMGRGRVDVRKDKEETSWFQVAGDEERPRAISHWKQFRVQLKDLSITVRRTLKETRTSMEVDVALAGQPGTRPLEVGSLVIEKAEDDTGKDITPSGSGSSHSFFDVPHKAGEDPDFVRFRDWMGAFDDDDSWKKISSTLQAGGAGATSIRVLKGRVALSFPLRHVEETVPRAELKKGRKIEVGPVTIGVNRFAHEKDRVHFDYSISSPGKAAFSLSFPDFDLLDAKGKVVSSGMSGSGGSNGYQVRYRVAKDVEVAGLRYSAYIGRIVVLVPFEFRDIPLPKRKKP